MRRKNEGIDNKAESRLRCVVAERLCVCVCVSVCLCVLREREERGREKKGELEEGRTRASHDDNRSFVNNLIVRHWSASRRKTDSEPLLGEIERGREEQGRKANGVSK